MAELDLICIGRAGVDFYAQQIGARLEDVGSFSKYIGGSSTNIACCSSRMGLNAALITRVGDDHMGRFIREQLEREGVDTRCVVTDPQRLTALVVLGIEDRDTFPLIFFRENCADMAISLSDFDEAYIASARALLITGTHFSQPQVYDVCREALRMARRNGVRTALDIDYRPVLWGLTESRGDGETRFIASDAVSEHLQGILPDFDLIVGTAEEIHIAGGSTDTLSALRKIRSLTDADIVLKRGPFGASVYPEVIPETLDEGITVAGVNVEVMNVLGAGDGFMAGFLRGWIKNEGYEQALTYANACGALVVSRHGCTPAMPTVEELDYYLRNSDRIARPDLDSELNYLHRVTTPRRRFEEVHALAFDNQELLKHAAQLGQQDRLFALNKLLIDTVERIEQHFSLAGRVGVFCDDAYGEDALNAATGRDWFVGRPVQVDGSCPVQFEGGGSVGSRLISWPLEHVVKCVVRFSADDDTATVEQQEEKILDLYRACCTSGHELMLDLDAEDVALLANAMRNIYELGVRPDWWGLPAASQSLVDEVDGLIEAAGPHCRGVLVSLRNGADLPKPSSSFVRGFCCVITEPANQWLGGTLSDDDFIDAVMVAFESTLQAWRGDNQASRLN